MKKMVSGLSKWSDIPEANKEHIKSRMAAENPEDDKKRKEKMKEDAKQEAKDITLEDQFTYDYAIVFRLPVESAEATQDEKDDCEEDYMHIARVLDYFRFADLKTFLYLGEKDDKTDEGRLICLLGADERRLKEEAARVEFDTLLRPDKIQEIGCAKKPSFILAQKVANDEEYRDFTDELFKGIYGIYKDFHEEVSRMSLSEPTWHERKSELYWTYNDSPWRPNSQFTELTRLKLTKIIIEAERDLHGADLTLASATRDKKYPVIGFFAMHEAADRLEIQEKFREDCSVVRDVCCCGTRHQPPDALHEEAEDEEEECCKVHPDCCYYKTKRGENAEAECCPTCVWVDYGRSDLHWKVRNYFGENIGLYFQFLTHYAIWLLPMAIIGTIIFSHQLYRHYTFDDDYTAGNYVFGIMMIIWASLFLESWKRVEKGIAVKWGMFRFEDKESVRPEYQGEWVESTETGEREEMEDFFCHFLRSSFSITVVGTYIALVILVVAGLLIVKTIMLRDGDGMTALIVPPLLNGVVIMIFNKLYGFISLRLTDFENHRTESEYLNAKIAKSFLFKAWNSYNSLLIIAFVKRNLPELKFCKQSYLYFFKGLEDQEKTFCADQNSAVCLATKSWISGTRPVEINTDSLFSNLPIGPPAMFVGGADNPIFLEVINNHTDGSVDWLAKHTDNLKGCENWPYWKELGQECSTESGGPAAIFLEPSANLCKQVCTVWAKLVGPRSYSYRGDCFMELTIQLAILFGTQLLLGNLFEIAIPYFTYQGKIKEAEEKATELSVPEKEMFYQQYEGTFDDYDELVLQFGYVVLFVVVFPATPLLAFINNILEFRVDGTKLSEVTRRPYPIGAQDIGVWYSTLSVLAYCAIIINTMLLFLLPSNMFPDSEWGLTKRFFIFSVLEHFLLILKFSISYFIPDTPAHIQAHLTRQEFITDVLIGR